MIDAGSTAVAGLRLLTSAIAGRPLDVAAVEPGRPAWTDGVVVFVDTTCTLTDQVCQLAVQACLVAAGSLDPDVLGALRRRPATARRYLTIEGHRALAANEAFLPPSVRPLVDFEIAAATDGPTTSLAAALGRAEVPPPPSLFGILDPRRVHAAGAAQAVNDIPAVHIARQDREQILRELDDGEDGERDGGFDSFNPIGGGGAVGRLLQKMLGNSRSSGSGQPGADNQTHVMKKLTRIAAGRAISSAPIVGSGAVDDSKPTGTTYPEWNVYERRYRPAWCSVFEVEPELVGSRPGVAPDADDLRRPLARLGVDLERRHRQLQGDDLDIDAVVDARAQLAAGCAPDEALYIDSLRQRRDLSALILLDVSGSASEPSASGGTVDDHQRNAAAALTTALHDLGDRVALYGFRSHGRAAVQILPVKRFERGLDAEARRRLAGMVPSGYTRLGAAIRHGTSALEAEGGTARRLLVVLSDGFAYDHGYEGEYGEADARRALVEARRRGTGCVCISVGAGVDAASLRRVFGTAAHAGVATVADLALCAAPLFRSALSLAEMQRRTFQRNERTQQRLLAERRSA